MKQKSTTNLAVLLALAISWLSPLGESALLGAPPTGELLAVQDYIAGGPAIGALKTEFMTAFPTAESLTPTRNPPVALEMYSLPIEGRKPFELIQVYCLNGRVVAKGCSAFFTKPASDVTGLDAKVESQLMSGSTRTGGRVENVGQAPNMTAVRIGEYTVPSGKNAITLVTSETVEAIVFDPSLVTSAQLAQGRTQR